MRRKLSWGVASKRAKRRSKTVYLYEDTTYDTCMYIYHALTNDLLFIITHITFRCLYYWHGYSLGHTTGFTTGSAQGPHRVRIQGLNIVFLAGVTSFIAFATNTLTF